MVDLANLRRQRGCGRSWVRLLLVAVGVALIHEGCALLPPRRLPLRHQSKAYCLADDPQEPLPPLPPPTTSSPPTSTRVQAIAQLTARPIFTLFTVAYASLAVNIVRNARNDDERYSAMHAELFSGLKSGMKVLEVGYGGGVNLSKGYYPKGASTKTV